MIRNCSQNVETGHPHTFSAMCLEKLEIFCHGHRSRVSPFALITSPLKIIQMGYGGVVLLGCDSISNPQPPVETQQAGIVKNFEMVRRKMLELESGFNHHQKKNMETGL